MKATFYLLLFSLGLFPIKCNADDELDLNLFHQHDYQVKFERVVLESYNKSLIELSIRTFKYNRTITVANITFNLKINANYDFTVIVQAYKFMSNEYRDFPLRFQMNWCKALESDVAGMDSFFNCGNFTGCPFRKGIKQQVCNWYPDMSKLPPLIPNGEYKIELQILLHSQEICVANVYGTISRPIVYTNDTARKG